MSEPQPSDRALKVVYLIPPAALGGAETVVGALSAGRTRRASVALLPNDPAAPFVARLGADGVPVHVVRARRRHCVVQPRAVADLVEEMGGRA